MADQDQQKENSKPQAVTMSASPESDQADAGDKSTTPSADELQLQRFGNNLEDVDEDMDDDEEEDEHDHIAHHPLLGMLAGRLGQPRRRGSTHKYDHLHPVTSVLTFADVDDCYELEQSFPENERASREKVIHITRSYLGKTSRSFHIINLIH